VYKYKTLIYEASSCRQLKKELNIGQSTVTKSLKDPSIKVFKVLNISEIGPKPDIKIKKVDAKTLKDLNNKYCTGSALASKRTTMKINLTLFDHRNNKSYTFKSSLEAQRFLIEKGVKISLARAGGAGATGSAGSAAAPKTLIKYRDTGTIYKNWSFYWLPLSLRPSKPGSRSARLRPPSKEERGGARGR
jgi:hypothetical protein